jgi:SAM-dependent methyltransferases related to tRNA (uracil-5-)-methyltransferase
MECAYYDRGVCRSCELMGVPYPQQLADKVKAARALLAAWPDAVWRDAVPSPESGFRNKAKMVVGGTVESPTLGILDAEQRGVDLRECGVLAAGLRAAMPAVAAFIGRAHLTPYDIPARRGELKNVLLTESPDGELMVRFVLRSTEALARIRKHADSLRADLPAISVLTVNLQPEHKAVLEGETELLLGDAETLAMRTGDVVLHLRPGGFFQTNTAIAAGLYAQAAAWLDEVSPRTVWDLYCGVGGFALHLAAPGREVVGIETSAAAVASARLTAEEAGIPGVEFEVGDAGAFAAERPAPDAVVVNPPRRGLGSEFAEVLERQGPATIVYSSCNPVTLAKDLAAMPSYDVVEVRLFDMFPQTRHAEVMTLLRRRGARAA